jgi:hypothetical protein
MIKKPIIIITSIGRTGTNFFSILFEEIIQDSTSLHEPDFLKIVRYHGVLERARQIIKQAKAVGIHNLVVRKAFGQWSLVKLSDARFQGKLDYERAVQKVLKQRLEFVRSRQGTVYIESSLAYYGLIDILPEVYKHHRLVYLVRDASDWIRSWMNWGITHREYGGMYGKSKIANLLGHSWPKAYEIAGDPYGKKWAYMSAFEKLCWAWSRLNTYAIETIPKNPNARVFRFEDIFESKKRYQNLEELIQFVTTIPGVEPVPSESLDGWLNHKVQKSSDQFPAWDEWTSEQKAQFMEMCGPLMKQLEYEFS